MAYELDLKPAMMDILSFMTETTILDSKKKAVGMVKEHVTKQIETSIQANRMVITKGKEKLTTRTELNIRDTGIEKMVV